MSEGSFSKPQFSILFKTLLIVFLITGFAALSAAEEEIILEQEWTYTEHTESVYAVTTDTDGNIYSGARDDEVHKINPDGTQEWTYTEHTEAVDAVTTDTDGNIYSGSRDEEVHKINPQGEQEWTYTEHTEAVDAVTTDTDGNIYSGSWDDEVHKINPDGTQEWTYTEHTESVYALTTDTDGNIYSGARDDEVHKINPDGTQEWTYTEHTEAVDAVTTDTDGNIYSGSRDEEVHKINPQGEQEWTYTEHTSNVEALTTDTDGNIYSGSWDEEVHKINPQGEQEWTYTEHTSNVEALTTDTDGNIYSGSWDDEVHKIVQLFVPVAEFDYPTDLSENLAEEEISFTDLSDPVSEEIVSWNWDFGDGTTSSEENPEHSYEEPGDYTVELTVENDDGQVDTHTEEVSVNSVPEAEFSYEPVDPEPEDDIEFFDESIDEYSSIESVEWEFGDGTTSTETSPVHSFEEPGEYNVSLTATDTYGVEETFWVEIVVPEEPMSWEEYQALYQDNQHHNPHVEEDENTIFTRVGSRVTGVFSTIFSLLPF